MKPRVHDSSFVHRTAVIIGNVEIGKNCGIWPGAVIRGDENSISIGDNSNVQDNCVIHVDNTHGASLGDNVSLGHGAVVHGAVIEDNVIVGMKAVVLNGAVVGHGSIIAAGALVKENTVIPPRCLVVGLPGRIVREDDVSLEEHAIENARTYVKLAQEHKSGRYAEF